MIARIDGDLIVYSVASATEGKYWLYKGTRWESKVLLNKALKQDGVDDSAIEYHSEPEEWENCIKSVLSYTQEIIDRLDCDYQIYLSGKSNFRFDVATILPYKGNRTDLGKPFHYDGIRQFLVDVFDAQVSVGMEADDLIGISHDPDHDVIVTLDKDLNCIPGLHYNWSHDECYWVSELDADRNFYCQVLTGDPTDNILGLYGVGSKSQLLKNVRTCRTEEEMFSLVSKEYEARFGSYWKQFMLENCRLLCIKQRREGLWEERLLTTA